MEELKAKIELQTAVRTIQPRKIQFSTPATSTERSPVRWENEASEFLEEEESMRKSLKKIFSSMTKETSEGAKSQNKRTCKLKAIDPGTFSGDIGEYVGFREVFRAVYDTADITNIERFIQLKACLRDDAKASISLLSPLPSSYEAAWRRFNNPRALYEDTLQIVMSHPQTIKGCPTSIMQLQEMAQCALHNLKT